MARQSQTPVQFNRTIRADDAVTMTSGRAGTVVPLTYIPLLRGDSAAGRVGIDVELAEMPRPLLNGVVANVQAWFVPKSSHPKFRSYTDFLHSYQGEQTARLSAAGAEINETPSNFFYTFQGDIETYPDDWPLAKAMGLHFPESVGGGNTRTIHTDLFDAYNQIWNFRAAAHSSRLERRQYVAEDVTEAMSLARAFWPTGRFSQIVPDYERALILGQLDLDVAAGQIPIEGIERNNTSTSGSEINANISGLANQVYLGGGTAENNGVLFDITSAGVSNIFAEMEGTTVGVTLADIDKARQTQSFAKLRAAYAGTDYSGFLNDDAILAELMQGFRVPEDEYMRPWLLDSARVSFGMIERHATDGASLDDSVTTGRASATLNLNVPQNDIGGVILVTLEVLPEQLHERASDEWFDMTTVTELPNALRDVQRVEPVDIVLNQRIDARHNNPRGTYGYEPMNNIWNRSYTRLGGAFYQDDPANPFVEQRQAIWQANVVNPVFSEDHFLAPEDFPHYVFSDTVADAFEVVARHSVRISGLTQIGDVLSENNDEYATIAEQEPGDVQP